MSSLASMKSAEVRYGGFLDLGPEAAVLPFCVKLGKRRIRAGVRRLNATIFLPGVQSVASMVTYGHFGKRASGVFRTGFSSRA